jgi:hypothetical protein
MTVGGAARYDVPDIAIEKSKDAPVRILARRACRPAEPYAVGVQRRSAAPPPAETLYDKGLVYEGAQHFGHDAPGPSTVDLRKAASYGVPVVRPRLLALSPTSSRLTCQSRRVAAVS